LGLQAIAHAVQQASHGSIPESLADRFLRSFDLFLQVFTPCTFFVLTQEPILSEWFTGQKVIL
jgi:hypothetical protein